MIRRLSSLILAVAGVLAVSAGPASAKVPPMAGPELYPQYNLGASDTQRAELLSSPAPIEMIVVVRNPNSGALSGIGFSMTLPSGLSRSSGFALYNSCGGTFVATSSSISLSGVLLAGVTNCEVHFGTSWGALGHYVIPTSAPVSDQANGTASSITLDVDSPPTVSATFSPGTVAPGGTTQLNFSIGNPASNAADFKYAGITDTLPAGLTVAGSTKAVCGGTLTTTAPSTIQLLLAPIARGATCTFYVPVTAGSAGDHPITTDPVFALFGTGGTASATLHVAVAAKATATPVASLGPDVGAASPSDSSIASDSAAPAGSAQESTSATTSPTPASSAGPQTPATGDSGGTGVLLLVGGAVVLVALGALGLVLFTRRRSRTA